MSTVLNHAISIPASPKRVWEQIRQIDKNPIWQANSERVAFLTSKQHGRGTRWRNYDNGSEQVVEITAWYEGLGYEYVIVDGAPFSSNRGRIRLQETPDGTVIQWTFSYEMSGMFGGLRNALGTRQRLDGDIVDSLRNIYRYIKDTKHTNYIPQESKALMKSAPSAKERSSYQPRHPSVLKNSSTTAPAADPDAIFRPPAQDAPSAPVETTPTVEPAAQQGVPIIEPPIDDDDTRPNPSVQESDELASAMPPEEPAAPAQSAAANAVPTPTTEDDPTRITQETYRPDVQETVPSSTISNEVQDTQAAPPEPEPSTPSASLSTGRKIEPAVEESTPEESITALEATESTAPAENIAADSEAAAPAPIEIPDTSNIDTAQVSVFDLFGVPRPSEAEKSDLGNAATTSDSITEPEPATMPTSTQEETPAAHLQTQETPVAEAAPSPDDTASTPAEATPVESPSQAIVPADAYKPAPDSPFADQTPIVPDVMPEPRGGRTGLRAKLRRQLARLRRP